MNNLEKQLNNEILHKKDFKSALSVKASDASSGEKHRSRIVSDKGNDQGLENQSNTYGDESSRSRNECNDKCTFGDDTDIRPSYDTKPIVEVLYTTKYNVFAVDTQHMEQPECIINTRVVKNVDSNVTPDSPNMCDNEILTDQNAAECDDERVALANLIANLKLDVDENKKIQKQLKKANTSLAHELKECKSILAKTSRTLGSLIIPYDQSDPANKLVPDKESLENAIDKLESDKAEFSNMYDILLQECVSSDVMCSYLHLLSDLDVHNELQCVYLRKVKECESQLQDKNIAISELKKLIEKCKGKYVETKFDKLSVVRQLNAQRILKASVLGKPTLFSDSLERKSFSKTKSVPKTNVSDGLSKLVTTQILPQTARQAIVQLILFIVDSGCTKHMMGNLKLLCNFVEKYLDLEVAFRKSTCFVRDLHGNDLLTGNRRSDLYTISLQEMTSSTLICLMAKASPTQAWLWH
ncbi:hypothetical protein Tco_1408099 [Tanacetum coccineum]